MNLIREAYEPGRIALAKCDEAKHQHGVQRMVEQAEASRFVGHHPATIQQKNDPLALVGLEVFDSQLIPSRRAPPVDVFVVVVQSIVSETLEFVILSNLPRATNAHQSETVRPCQDCVFRKLLHIRVYKDLRFERTGYVQTP